MINMEAQVSTQHHYLWVWQYLSAQQKSMQVLLHPAHGT